MLSGTLSLTRALKLSVTSSLAIDQAEDESAIVADLSIEIFL